MTTTDHVHLHPPRSFAQWARDLVALTKPGIVASNALTAGCGAWLAPGAATVAEVATAIAGTGLLVAACGSLNQYMEREYDARMSRTSTRPLAAGRAPARDAVLVAVAGIVAGIAILAQASVLAAALGALATFVYVLVYTPMKRVSPWSVPVGAIAGALPPVIGWAVATGGLAAGAGWLFAVLFTWQIPHFAGIALRRGDEYRRAGLRIAPPPSQTRWAILGVRLCTLGLLGAIAALAPLADRPALFLIVAIGAALPMLRAVVRPVQRPVDWGKSVFLSSLAFLPLFALATAL